MKTVLKVAIVAGGYLLAFLMAFAAVALHAAFTGESGAQASDGMSAFGDLVLFVAVFGAVALVPTGVAIFFILSKRNRPDQATRPTSTDVTATASHPSRHP
jgi:uncharacterized membrane protein